MKGIIRTIGLLTMAGIVASLNTPAGEDASQVAATVEINITASPQVLILGLQGEWLTIHTDVSYWSVVGDSVTLQLEGETVTPDALFADARGNLVAKFDQATIQGLVSPPSASVTLTGVADGQGFTGSDTIEVKRLGKK